MYGLASICACRALDKQDKYEEAVACYEMASLRIQGGMHGFLPFGESAQDPAVLPSEAHAHAVAAMVGKGVALGRYDNVAQHASISHAGQC